MSTQEGYNMNSFKTEIEIERIIQKALKVAVLGNLQQGITMIKVIENIDINYDEFYNRVSRERSYLDDMQNTYRRRGEYLTDKQMYNFVSPVYNGINELPLWHWHGN